MVIVPFRAAPAFAATLKPTDPLPLPLAPELTVIQDALLPAVQLQLPPEAVTAIAVPAPPAAAIDSFVDPIVYVQLGGDGGVGGFGGGGGDGGDGGVDGPGCVGSPCVIVCV